MNTTATPRPPGGRRRPAASERPTVLGLPPVFVLLVSIVSIVALGLGIALIGHDAEPDAGAQATFAPVAVTDAALPALAGGPADAAVGIEVPTLTGFDPAGDAVVVGPSGTPTLVAFLAHWCSHCQAEVPLLVAAQSDGLFDGIRTVAVLTGTNPQAPNFPPAAWLDREGWAGDVLVDDESGTAAAAYGLAGYPFLAWVDADGRVVARTSGELTFEELGRYADAVRGGA